MRIHINEIKKRGWGTRHQHTSTTHTHTHNTHSQLHTKRWSQACSGFFFVRSTGFTMHGSWIFLSALLVSFSRGRRRVMEKRGSVTLRFWPPRVKKGCRNRFFSGRCFSLMRCLFFFFERYFLSLSVLFTRRVHPPLASGYENQLFFLHVRAPTPFCSAKEKKNPST